MKDENKVPLLNVVSFDLMLAALIVALIIFLCLGVPLLQSRAALRNAPPPTPAPSPAPTVQAAEPTEDPRSEWQIRFAEHFSEETEITERSYRSENVSIEIETRQFGEGYNASVYHVADIYLGSPELFRTYTANGRMVYYETQPVEELDAAAHAILCISGDFLTYQNGGFLMRNGEFYRQGTPWNDVCVLYADGVMETYPAGACDAQAVLDREPTQIWSFGPALLDAEGHARGWYSVSTAVSYPNPRSAVGYYEPGHYCFVVVDGRQDGYSHGMTVPELARVFEELGCSAAYNLDGGGSAVMLFNHTRVSRQSNGGGRQLGDILLITEPGWEEKT